MLAGCGGAKSTSTTATTGQPGEESSTTVGGGEASTTAPGAAAPTTGGSAPTSRPAGPAAGGTAPSGANRTTTTLKPTAPPAAVSKAKGYLLTGADLGPEYTKDDRGDGGESDDGMEKCGKGNPVFANNNPNRFSGDVFRKGASFADAALATSAATVAASTAQASEAMAIAKSDEFLRCIEQQAREQAAKRAPQGTTFDAKAERRAYSAGDDAVQIHVTVTGSYGAQKFTGDVDSFGIRKGADVVLGVVTVIGPSNAGEPARIGEILRKKTA